MKSYLCLVVLFATSALLLTPSARSAAAPTVKATPKTAAAAATPVANTSTFKVDFEPAPISYDEFAIEARQRDGTWVEVAKGPASPITFTATNLVAGTAYTVRLYSRSSIDPAQRGPMSDEASADLTAGAPRNPTISVTVQTIITVTK